MVTLGFKSGYTYRADLRCHEHLWPLDTFSRVRLWGQVSVVTEGPQDASRDTALGFKSRPSNYHFSSRAHHRHWLLTDQESPQCLQGLPKVRTLETQEH